MNPNSMQSILIGNVWDKLGELPDKSIHMILSSPPYWSCRNYLKESDVNKALEFGREDIPECNMCLAGIYCGECYVCKTVFLFRELRRVLRDDGIIAWNLADVYFDGRQKGH